MVVGKGDSQGVKAELHQRTEEACHEQYFQRHLRHDCQRQSRYRQAQGKAANQQCAVIAVRQPAQRPLHDQSSKNAATHEQADLLSRQALLRGVERCQAVERTDDQPGAQHGAERLRHALDKEARLHRGRVQWGRVNASSHRHRDQAQREAQRHEHQQLKPKMGMHDQDQLAQHQPKVGRNHVAAEHYTALLGIRLLVEPTLDDHVLAHHPQAHDHPQHNPGWQPINQTVTQHCCADDPRAGGVGTNMPDPGNQAVPELAAQHQAKIVGSHQCTHPQAVDIVCCQAQSQISTKQAGADQHHQGGEIKGSKRFPDLAHRRSERLLAVRGRAISMIVRGS